MNVKDEDSLDYHFIESCYKFFFSVSLFSELEESYALDVMRRTSSRKLLFLKESCDLDVMERTK